MFIHEEYKRWETLMGIETRVKYLKPKVIPEEGAENRDLERKLSIYHRVTEAKLYYPSVLSTSELAG